MRCIYRELPEAALALTQLAANLQGSWGRTGFATNSHDIFNVVCTPALCGC